MIKLLIGGSPCTYWSIAQKNNRETEAQGIGWELFKNYVIAKEKFKPDFFLYENNKSAAKSIKEQIRKELDVDGTNNHYIEINSALVSAQNRERFYVHNCGDVEQPEDRGILLRDILESGTRIPPYSNEESRPINALYPNNAGLSIEKRIYGDNPNKHQIDFIAEPINMTSDQKAQCLRATYYKDGIRNLVGNNVDRRTAVAEPVRIGLWPRLNGEMSDSQGMRIYSVDGKSIAQTANGGGHGAKTGLYAMPINITNDEKSQTIKATYKLTSIANICCYNSTYGATGVALPADPPPSEQCRGNGKDENAMKRIYEVKDGLITIKGKQYPIKLADGYYIIRKLTVKECCLLQTMPDNYCRAVSDTQAYKGLGNSWTAEVIIHILLNALKDIPKDEEIIVLSMYDGIGTGRYCLDKMGFKNVKYYAYEIDKYAIQIAKSNYPDIIECGNAFQIREGDWALPENNKGGK